MTASPTKGIALYTFFTVSLLNWESPELPLSYQFFYKLPQDSVWTLCTPNQEGNSTNLEVPGKAPSVNLTFQGEIIDALGAYSYDYVNVTLGMTRLTGAQIVAKFDKTITNLSPTDHLGNLQTLLAA
jgi:hypothetical protein